MAQTFNPDHVKVYENKDGSIPQKYNELILKEVIDGSQVTKLAKYEQMDGKEKTFEYFAEAPGAYWVGETEKIKTSTAKWLTCKMEAKKLGVIMPVSREYLHYSMSNFFEVMKPKIAEAFYKKFDEAVLLNVNNPFSQSLEQSVTESKQIITGDLDYKNIIALEDAIADEDYDLNAFISTKQNNSLLRDGTKNIENGVITETLYDRKGSTLDGYPVVDLRSPHMEKGTLYAGDFGYMYYGIPYGMAYKISEEAQLSTITNEDGSPINLYEQEMMALRVTMDIAFMIIKDNAFAKIEKKK